MKNYILLGMGYVSPKHLQAIKETGGNLVAYLDVHDVVGQIDKYFIGAKYYNEFIHLDCFIDRYQAGPQKIDYCIICLPNHLHNPACRWAMNQGMDVICEKPLVIHEKNLDELLAVEEKTGKKVNVVLQCRLHPEAIKAKEKLNTKDEWVKYLKIDYKTPRGAWYAQSWKGDVEKSGGLCTNIGIHMFDLSMWLFGPWIQWQVESFSPDEVSGFLVLKKAEVEWTLSVRPGEPKRIFSINSEEINLTNGFQNLHTETYRKVLSGEGFGIEDIRLATRLVENIRDACK